MKKLPPHTYKRKAGEPARDELVRILKLRGKMSVAELCKNLKLTQTAVRRYITHYQSKGLISSELQHRSKGRPVYIYRLSENASAAFPSGYEDLVEQFLDTVYESGGHKAVMDFLKANNDRIISSLFASFINKSLQEKVEALARYFVERGYMTDWTKLPDGNFFLYHQNCAIYKMAVRYRQLCILEPRLIECLLGVKISRQQYILKDQPICGYLIDAKRSLYDSR